MMYYQVAIIVKRSMVIVETNMITTGGGQDKIVVMNDANTRDIITDFDVNNDAISLQQFSNVTFSDLIVMPSSSAGTEVIFPNSQAVELQGVDPNAVNASLFIQGVYVLSWQSGSGDTVIHHFNLNHDLIDLNYAFGFK